MKRCKSWNKQKVLLKLLSKALTGLWTTYWAATNQMTIPLNKLPWFELLCPSIKSSSSSVPLPPKQPPKQWENDLNHEDILFKKLCKTVEVSEASPEFATLSTYCHGLQISKFLFVTNSQKSNLIWPQLSNLSTMIYYNWYFNMASVRDHKVYWMSKECFEWQYL